MYFDRSSIKEIAEMAVYHDRYNRIYELIHRKFREFGFCIERRDGITSQYAIVYEWKEVDKSDGTALYSQRLGAELLEAASVEMAINHIFDLILQQTARDAKDEYFTE